MIKLPFLCFLLAVTLMLHGCSKECEKAPELQPVPVAVDSTQNTKLFGYWQVDSLMHIQGNWKKSHLMDTVHGISATTTKRIIFQLTDDSVFHALPGYHWGINGSYKLLSLTRISFAVEQDIDFAGRPKSDWQPLVVSALNVIETYRVEGDGSRNSQLFLYSDPVGRSILRCTKL